MISPRNRLVTVHTFDTFLYRIYLLLSYTSFAHAHSTDV